MWYLIASLFYEYRFLSINYASYSFYQCQPKFYFPLLHSGQNLHAIVIHNTIPATTAAQTIKVAEIPSITIIYTP